MLYFIIWAPEEGDGDVQLLTLTKKRSVDVWTNFEESLVLGLIYYYRERQGNWKLPSVEYKRQVRRIVSIRLDLRNKNNFSSSPVRILTPTILLGSLTIWSRMSYTSQKWVTVTLEDSSDLDHFPECSKLRERATSNSCGDIKSRIDLVVTIKFYDIRIDNFLGNWVRKVGERTFHVE